MFVPQQINIFSILHQFGGYKFHVTFALSASGLTATQKVFGRSLSFRKFLFSETRKGAELIELMLLRPNREEESVKESKIH